MTEEKTTEETTVSTPEQNTPEVSSDAVVTPEVAQSASESTEAKPAADAKPAEPQKSYGRRDSRGGSNPRARGGRRPMRREKPEFDQKIVSLRRVVRVMAGGRRFSFSAAIVIGDRKGRVGFGVGKANDTAAAIDKAVRVAKKNMLNIKRTETNSIPHDSQAKYKASEVMLRPVTGKGLAAGGGVRTVLELAGIDEVGGKLLSRSKNNINNSKATLLALLPFATNRKDITI